MPHLRPCFFFFFLEGGRFEIRFQGGECLGVGSWVTDAKMASVVNVAIIIFLFTVLLLELMLCP